MDIINNDDENRVYHPSFNLLTNKYIDRSSVMSYDELMELVGKSISPWVHFSEVGRRMDPKWEI